MMEPNDPRPDSGQNQGQSSAPQHDAPNRQGMTGSGTSRANTVRRFVKAAAKSGLAEEIAAIAPRTQEKAPPERSPGDSFPPQQEPEPQPQNGSGSTRRIILIAAIACVLTGALIWLIVSVTG